MKKLKKGLSIVKDQPTKLLEYIHPITVGVGDLWSSPSPYSSLPSRLSGIPGSCSSPVLISSSCFGGKIEAIT